MKKLIKRIINTILVLFGLASAVGLVYTLFPEYFNFAFQTIGLTEEQVGMATFLLAGITTFGSLSKYLSGVVKTQTLLQEQENSARLDGIEKKYSAEVEVLRSQKNEETKLYSGIINELIDQQNQNNKKLDQVIEIQAITARRNADSNNRLVSEQDKQLYRDFLKGLNDGKSTVEVENLYTTLTLETIKEPQKEETVEVQDKLSERL